jgi:hypothetical protein
MNFAALSSGASIFLDANPFVYHFAADPVFGPACNQLITRIHNQEIVGLTSTHVLSEAAHHLMTLEAATRFGWTTKVVQRLKQFPDNLRDLTTFRTAIESIPSFGVRVLTIPVDLIATAAELSQQTGLLSNDALIVAVMRAHSITHLASNDPDFDRVPGLVRFAPAGA